MENSGLSIAKIPFSNSPALIPKIGVESDNDIADPENIPIGVQLTKLTLAQEEVDNSLYTHYDLQIYPYDRAQNWTYHGYGSFFEFVALGERKQVYILLEGHGNNYDKKAYIQTFINNNGTVTTVTPLTEIGPLNANATDVDILTVRGNIYKMGNNTIFFQLKDAYRKIVVDETGRVTSIISVSDISSYNSQLTLIPQKNDRAEYDYKISDNEYITQVYRRVYNRHGNYVACYYVFKLPNGTLIRGAEQCIEYDATYIFLGDIKQNTFAIAFRDKDDYEYSKILPITEYEFQKYFYPRCVLSHYSSNNNIIGICNKPAKAYGIGELIIQL